MQNNSIQSSRYGIARFDRHQNYTVLDKDYEAFIPDK